MQPTKYVSTSDLCTLPPVEPDHSALAADQRVPQAGASVGRRGEPLAAGGRREVGSRQHEVRLQAGQLALWWGRHYLLQAIPPLLICSSLLLYIEVTVVHTLHPLQAVSEHHFRNMKVGQG